MFFLALVLDAYLINTVLGERKKEWLCRAFRDDVVVGGWGVGGERWGLGGGGGGRDFQVKGHPPFNA